MTILQLRKDTSVTRETHNGTDSNPNLIEKDEKDDVVPKSAEAIQHRHLDDESENVVDERIQRLRGKGEEDLDKATDQ